MSNSNLDAVAFRSLRLVGVSVGSRKGPGFAIPLLVSRSDGNATYVQRTDRGGRIVGFQVFIDRCLRQPVAGNRSVAVGDPEVFALLDIEGVVHVGTRDELSPKVKEWLTKIEAPLTKMNYALFCNARAVAYKAAFDAVQRKEVEFSSRNNAVIWFMGSVIVAPLLKALTKNMKDEAVVEDCFKSADVVVRQEGKNVYVELPRWVDPLAIRKTGDDFGGLVDLAKSATECDLVIGVRGRGYRDPRVERRYNSRPVNDLIERRIRPLRRQEERIAEVIRVLLTEGRAGFDVLERYEDVGSFANYVIGDLRRGLSPGMNAELIEQRVARSLKRYTSRAVSFNRVKFLFHMAERLGSFRQISNSLRSIVFESGSQAIAAASNDILLKLG
ncbi:hypothetical protein LRC39_03030 [Rhodopseudomonas sp. P1]|uniref:hypothetical protein n=1 Tax=Rhodopseudomonas sp. P1 TaxID=3434357 RepID=UPI0031FBF30B